MYDGKNFVDASRFSKGIISIFLIYFRIYVAEISVKLTSSRYLITVRPDTELEEIDKLLVEKGYVEKASLPPKKVRL